LRLIPDPEELRFAIESECVLRRNRVGIDHHRSIAVLRRRVKFAQHHFRARLLNGEAIVHEVIINEKLGPRADLDRFFGERGRAGHRRSAEQGQPGCGQRNRLQKFDESVHARGYFSKAASSHDASRV
jgi:hypothetical protein